jgi:hypothetical protein
MYALDALKSVRFVVDQGGKPSAIQLDMDVWEDLLSCLEDVEDVATVRDMLPRLQGGPRQPGTLRWDEVKAEWDSAHSES